MFGFVGELRSSTQGKGEYSMEYSKYAPTPQHIQEKIVSEYQQNMNLQVKKKN